MTLDAVPRPVARLPVTVAAAAVSLYMLRSFVSTVLFTSVGNWKDEFGVMLADILKQNKVNNSDMRFDPRARTANSDWFIADYENDHISYCWPALLNFREKEEEIEEEAL